MTASKQNRDLIDAYRRQRRFADSYVAGLRHLLEGYDLSLLEGEILLAIVADPECDTVTRLCADIGKTKGVVSRGCDHLCRRNYLRTEDDAVDHRVVHFRTATASRSLIPVIGRYLETMAKVQAATVDFVPDDDVLFYGRLERRKSRVYPIYRRDDRRRPFEPLPHRDYVAFLTELGEEYLTDAEAARLVAEPGAIPGDTAATFAAADGGSLTIAQTPDGDDACFFTIKRIKK